MVLFTYRLWIVQYLDWESHLPVPDSSSSTTKTTEILDVIILFLCPLQKSRKACNKGVLSTFLHNLNTGFHPQGNGMLSQKTHCNDLHSAVHLGVDKGSMFPEPFKRDYEGDETQRQFVSGKTPTPIKGRMGPALWKQDESPNNDWRLPNGEETFVRFSPSVICWWDIELSTSSLSSRDVFWLCSTQTCSYQLCKWSSVDLLSCCVLTWLRTERCLVSKRVTEVSKCWFLGKHSKCICTNPTCTPNRSVSCCFVKICLLLPKQRIPIATNAPDQKQSREIFPFI